jgi:ubiquinone/menaquinone biosynthesis C-methylase UbiE
VRIYPRAKRDFIRRLPAQAALLDVGCLGFAVVETANAAGRNDLRHFGVDYAPAAGTRVPEGFTFVEADVRSHGLPFEDDSFDAVVASHVIEHVPDPIALIAECVRVCKPGGAIYIECPSERSLLLPGVPIRHEMFCSFSYFDDPTHTSRPWTPQSLYRIARYLGCVPREAGHVTSALHRLAFPVVFPLLMLMRDVARAEQMLWLTVGWSSYAVIDKPADAKGKPDFRYYVPPRRNSHHAKDDASAR